MAPKKIGPSPKPSSAFWHRGRLFDRTPHRTQNQRLQTAGAKAPLRLRLLLPKRNRENRIMDLATLSFVERKQGLILAGSPAPARAISPRLSFSSDAANSTAAGIPQPPTCSRISWPLWPTAPWSKSSKLYTRPDILLIDEVGFDRLEQESARNASLFFKVIDQRYCKASTLLTTNIDFKALGDYLGDPVITTAIVDRMVHHSIIINIQGPSWRMNESKKLNASQKSKSPKKADPARPQPTLHEKTNPQIHRLSKGIPLPLHLLPHTSKQAITQGVHTYTPSGSIFLRR